MFGGPSKGGYPMSLYSLGESLGRDSDPWGGGSINDDSIRPLEVLEKGRWMKLEMVAKRINKSVSLVRHYIGPLKFYGFIKAQKRTIRGKEHIMIKRNW
jgi:hypothetical protein